MRLRTRLLVALAFVALFGLAPKADGPAERAFLAQLRVREWLLEPAGPLRAWRDGVERVERDGPVRAERDGGERAERGGGTLPPLAVDLRISPPIEDAAARQRATAEYARSAAEWAAARTAEGEPTRIDPARTPVPLVVIVGSNGVQAALPVPDGPAAQLVRPFATRLSLVPAVLAIALAVLTQRVLLALLLGCIAGAIAHVATAVPGQTPGVWIAIGGGLEHFALDALWRRSVLEDFYLRITLFVVFLFMTVGVITRNGGVHGMVERLRRRVRGPVSAQLCTFAAGIAVFFDDYTNCLLVGSSMRPLCDASRVSREKLAWLVDSTAAPIAGLSVFSTWITYEMSQYRAPLALVTRADGMPYVPDDAFAVFLATIPFRCYCLFTLAFVALVVLLRRDFGPMLAAERRARAGAPPLVAHDAADGRAALAAPAVPHRARNAVVPLAVLVLGTIVGMIGNGAAAAAALPATADFPEVVRTVLASSRSDVALLGASIAAFVVAVAMTLAQRLLTAGAVVRVALGTTRHLWLPFGILFLAWALGHLCRDLGTSFYLTAAARGAMTAALLPVLLFVIAGAIAFATGTSFGTMAILLPNVVVLAHQLGTESAFTGDPAVGGPALMLLCIGAVLEGAIFGDHCSPISDTTVLSSLGARCNLLAHVATQLPYALLVAAVTIGCGYVPLVVLGPTWWPLCLVAGVLVLALVLRWCGRDPDAPAAAGAPLAPPPR